MPNEKGSFLDKLKTFFIRRRNNKLKKKEQERKELEQILKNISEKVEAPSMVVRVNAAVDKINLSRVVLTTSKSEVKVLPKINVSKNNEISKGIAEPMLKNTSKEETKEVTQQEIAYETINTMDNSELHKLREKLLSSRNDLPKHVISNNEIKPSLESSKENMDVKPIKNENKETYSKPVEKKNEEIHVQPIYDVKNQELGKTNIKENLVDSSVINTKDILFDTNQKESVIQEVKPLKSDVNVSRHQIKKEEFIEKTNIKENLVNSPVINTKDILFDNNEKKSVMQEVKPLKSDINVNKQQVRKENLSEKTLQSSRKVINVNKKSIKRIKFIFDSRFKKKDITSFKFKNKKNSNKSKEQEVSLILIRMIDRNLSELSYFKEELEYLTDKNKNAKTKEEIFEVEQRFLILKERLEKVYNDFLVYRDKNIIQEIGDLSYNEELVDLITKYKLDVSDNGNIEEILRNIESDYKSSLNIIESIVCLEESKEILGDEIYKNKEDIRVRDEKLSATGEVVEKINFMKEELDRNISSNKEVINSIIEKINSISPEVRVRYQFNVVNNLINSAFSFAFATTMLNPRNGRLSNALGAVCMLNSIRSLGRIFRPREEVYYVASGDFENEIIEHLNDFSYINKTIDLSIEEIDKIKNEFDDKYLHLIDDIPEISETYLKINNLQDQLKDIKVEMKHQENRLEYSRELNNQIVKRIEG